MDSKLNYLINLNSYRNILLIDFFCWQIRQLVMPMKKMNTKPKIIYFFLFCSIVFGQAFNGLTLFSPIGNGQGQGNSQNSYLIDNELNLLHLWEHQRGAASMPYLIQDSTLVYPYRVQNPTMSSGGVGGGISIFNWNGDLLWYSEIANEIYQHHHDIEPLPNGNILVLVWERHPAIQGNDSPYYGNSGKGWQEMGRISVNNNLNEMWSTAILELVPFSDENDIVWEWHLWDHLIQDVDLTLPNYGIIADHPELQDINFGNVGSNQGPGGPNADWKHCNAIAYNDALDQIVISSRHHNEIYIIDHSTTTEQAAGHTGGNYGKGGDFLYRWGNPQVYDRGTAGDQKLNSQHGVNWIIDGYPGSGNLILFNNDYVSAGQQSQSAVFEIETPVNENGIYDIVPDQAYGPENPVWIYTGSFHSNVQSGAFRLQNGNTLVTDANSNRIFEVSQDHSIVWDYIYSGNGSMIARAQKYPLAFLSGDFPEYISGDVNFDQIINVMDILMINDMFHGYGYPNSPPADYNGDGSIDISDIFLMAQFILNN